MENSPYLCPTIRHFIKSEPSRKSTYAFKDPAIEVKIWSPLQGPTYDHEYLARLTHILTRWIRDKSWSQFSTSDRWTIEIWLTPMKKRWCTGATGEEKQIGICEANSGETEQSRGRVHIRIIRAECCVRTILHELLHAHRWDRLVPNHADDYEGLVEGCARLFYCQWFGRSRWRSMLAQELVHAKRQVDFLRHSRWTTTTHIVAYYYLSVALLDSLDDFQTWLRSSSRSHDLRASWPTLKDRVWKKLYGGSVGKSIQLENTERGCLSLAMVKYQAPLTVQDAQIEFLKPPALSGSARSGGGGPFFMPTEVERRPLSTLTVIVGPATTIRHANAAPYSKWMVTDGQGFVTPYGWLKRGQTFQVGAEPMDLSLRNENRWYPFIVVQLEPEEEKEERKRSGGTSLVPLFRPYKATPEIWIESPDATGNEEWPHEPRASLSVERLRLPKSTHIISFHPCGGCAPQMIFDYRVVNTSPNVTFVGSETESPERMMPGASPTYNLFFHLGPGRKEGFVVLSQWNRSGVMTRERIRVLLK